MPFILDLNQGNVCDNINFWLFNHYFLLLFFVPLTLSKVLSFEKIQIKFGFLLAYSYLCTVKK